MTQIINGSFRDALISMNGGQITYAANIHKVPLPDTKRKGQQFWIAVHRYRVLDNGLSMGERAASLAWLNKIGSTIKTADRIDAPQGGIEGRLYTRRLIEFGVIAGA